MGKKTGKLINRLLMGSEKSEDFARNSLPSNRWELFWDIFKGSFGKLVLINLLMLLFFIPLIFLLYCRSVLVASYGSMYPFSQGFGVGYLAPISFQGMSESIAYMTNAQIYLLLPVTMIIAAVGLSGGAYVIRNVVWTEGVFVANDFWRGIKINFKQIVIVCLIYSLVFYITVLSASISRYNIASGADMKWLFYICEILSYILLGYFSLMTLYMITSIVTYEMPLKGIIKNSFFFTLAFLPHSIFFAFIGSIPFILFMISDSIVILMVIAILVILIFGFSFFMLVWTDYSQWCFDTFINGKVEGAKKNRGIYEKVKSESASKAAMHHRAVVRTSLNSRPIKPITDEEVALAELPDAFNREDLLRLKQSKQDMIEDHNKYVEEHKNDEQYQKTEEELAQEQAEKDRIKKIEKAKKALRKFDKNE